MDAQRHLQAQDDGSYQRALAELRNGRKTSHWVWYVLPQLAGLGRSSTAMHYALADRREAQEYLSHPVLGARLKDTVAVLLSQPDDDPVAVMGTVDAMKLRSCLTLFDAVEPNSVFGQALARFYDGPDQRTLDLLAE